MGEVKERRAGRWAGPLCTVGGLCVPANTCYTPSRTLRKPDCFVNLNNTANLALHISLYSSSSTENSSITISVCRYVCGSQYQYHESSDVQSRPISDPAACMGACLVATPPPSSVSNRRTKQRKKHESGLFGSLLIQPFRKKISQQLLTPFTNPYKRTIPMHKYI